MSNKHSGFVGMRIVFDNIFAILGYGFNHVAHVFGSDGYFSVAQNERGFYFERACKE